MLSGFAIDADHRWFHRCRAINITLEQQLSLQAIVVVGEMGFSPDFAEGRNAFLEKFVARFTGD